MLEGLEKKAQAVLDALGCPEKELSILLVDDLQIADLNATYLQREGPSRPGKSRRRYRHGDAYD